MQNSKKTFIAGLNADDAFFSHKQDDNVDALNARVISSSEGKSGSLSNILGNREVTNPFLLFGGGDNKVIGTHEDPTTNDVFYFVTKTSGYSYIFKYDSSNEAIYVVLQDSNIEGGYQLNFQDEEAVTGVAYTDGLLYWTGVKDREPSKVNVFRGIKTNHPGLTEITEDAYETPIKKSVLTVIRKPPMLPLEIRVDTDSTRDTSFLKSRSLTFAYRYVYRDGEISVFSPTTPHYPNQDMDNNNHETTKKIVVGYPTREATPTGIADDIEKIQFGVKFDKDTSYFIWKEFTRGSHPTEFNTQTDLVNFVIKGDYYNDVLGSAVDDSNSIKLYDTVPYEAKALEIARNRLFLGNIKEGLINTRKMTDLDMTVQIETAPFNVNTFNQEIRDRGGIVGYSCASAYQVGLAFFDFAGRTAGVLTDDSMKVITSERSLTYTSYNSFINYTLNTSADQLIPEWATHYSILRTKNLTKDFTIGNLADKIRYYQIDSTGNFTVRIEKVDSNGDPTGKFSESEHTAFDSKHEGIAIGLGDLTSYKQGYSYQEGDRIKLITSNRVMEFAVTGQFGRFVTTNLVDLNSGDYIGVTNLANSDYTIVYEIYSPHKIQPNEFYYESVRGKILNPGTSSRSYDTGSGRLIGDVYMKARRADTSTVPVHFEDGSVLSKNDHDQPFKGKTAYIGLPYFHGTGLNDLSTNTQLNGFTGSVDRRFEIKITQAGTPDKFQWRSRVYSQRTQNPPWSSNTSITGSSQSLSNGVTITFAATTGHTVGDEWSVHGKTEGNQLGNVNSRTYSHFISPPNDVIFSGSEVKVHQKEYRDRWPSSDQHHEFTVTMTPAEITENYATIEELFWRTSFGTKLCANHPDDHILFRRGTINPSGDNGKSRMNILDSAANGNTPVQVSNQDGTGVHLILKSRLEQGSDLSAPVDTKFDIKVDVPDEYFYSAESMNPSDDYFLNWVQITGRPNLVANDVTAQDKVTGIVFSETKIPGSKVNGLSKFSALDEDRLDDATGPLRILTITSKTQSTGTVLLAISENETTSIYLGESQLQQASSGNQFLSVTKGVIGTKNALQGSFGTVHPESVVVNEGRAYWFDLKNATIVKYDSNGLKAIGDVKMKSYFKEKSDIIVSDTVKDFIPATYDAFNNEYLITMPQTGEVTVQVQGPGTYPSKPNIAGTHAGTVGGGGTNYTGDINVFINGFKNPINKTIGVNNGVGVVGFNAPNGFKIPTNAITAPNPSQGMTVANAASGGFTVDSNDPDLLLSGHGALDFTNIPSTATSITITLTEVVIAPATQDVLVVNKLGFIVGDGKAQSESGEFGTTPIRLINPTFQGYGEESKLIAASTGTIVIPFTSNFPFKLGSTNPNTGFRYVNDNIPSVIPISNISTNATAIGSDPTLHYYQAGSWNLTITGILPTTSEINIDSRKLELAVVTTSSATNVTVSGFNMLGNLVSVGTGTATEKGFVFAKEQSNPVIGGTGVSKRVASDTALGVFERSVSGLDESTIYYYRAYVITEVGTEYGNNILVATGSSANSQPTVETLTYVAKDNKAEGNITADGGASISTFGFLIHTSTNPTIGTAGVINKSYTTPINTIPHGYECDLSSSELNLQPSTTYYYRAYATNNIGTGYGVSRTFTTDEASSGGVGFITLITSQIPADGGSVSVRISKTFDTGAISGILSMQDTTGGSHELSYSMSASENNTISLYPIGANNEPFARTIGFSVQDFTPEGSNQTGDATPILLSQTVNQGTTNPGNDYEEQK